ncbi:MAG: dihydrodipicolinate synthase family protein [Deltaproteobacteria bacterium]|nr:dihydrodipicolinate synthase family protein [Deltaproteobacteria bacterium]
MTHSHRLRGVLSPVLTPFTNDLEPDAGRFAQHCRWLSDSGVGLAIFGTNSEGNSLSVTERLNLLDALLDAGIDPAQLMPGAGCCALPDTVALTRRAVAAGCAGVLMLPPFYYKSLSDDGLFRSYSEVIQRVGDGRLRVYLYHIPPVAQVPLGLDLIARLLKEYPGTIAGIKDSSGDWNNTDALLRSFQSDAFDVFCGSEVFLLQTLRGGGAGCITATGNVNPAAIADLYATWKQPGADEKQAELTAMRRAFEIMPMIPAMKAAIAWQRNDEQWCNVRPPLMNAPADKAARLRETLAGRGFTMPGIERGA